MSLLLAGGFLLSLAPLTGFNPHYAAAGTSLLYLLLVQGMERMSGWRCGGKRVGLGLAIFFIALFPAGLAEYLSMVARDGGYVRPVVRARQQVIQTLDAIPGGHVVLLRYSPTHCVHREWVYNLADIDRQRIIWAHEMGPEWDRAFVEHYRGRQVWVLDPDQSPVRLMRYADAPAPVWPTPAARPASDLLEVNGQTCPSDVVAPTRPLLLIDPNNL